MKFGLKDALTLIAQNKKNKNPLLDLSNLGLQKIPSAVFELAHLEELVLGVDYESKDGIRINRDKYDTLGIFHVDHEKAFVQNQIKEIPDRIAQLKKLSALHLSGNKIVDFSSLQGLPKLVTLDIGYHGFSKLSTLKSLVHLKKLNVRNCHIEQLTDLPPLANLAYLLSLIHI